MALSLTGTGQGGVLTLKGGAFGGSFRAITTPVDPDVQAFFSRVTVAGGTLSAIEQTAIKTLVDSLKTAGLWALMKAIYPMVGASAAACAQNLKSSSFTGTFTSGWTFASTGAKPNGTSAYMNTGLNPFIEYLTIASAHISAYSRTNAVDGFDASVAESGKELTLAANLNISPYFASAFIGTQFASATPPNTLGLFIGNRQSATDIRIIQNTTILATNTTLSNSVPPNRNLFLAVQNSATIGAYTSREQAFTSIGEGLTNPQASSLYTIVQAFQTTLSRQV